MPPPEKPRSSDDIVRQAAVSDGEWTEAADNSKKVSSPTLLLRAENKLDTSAQLVRTQG
jgi:hypothetical protein